MINYKQLHYFWRVARDGGVTRASEQLHLTPQTLSGQISQLEKNLGTPLFKRVGRRLELTETGRMALSYADDIFRTGNELEQVLRGSAEGRPLLLRVGIADVLPKSIAYRLLLPAMQLNTPLRLICREDKLTRLMAELAIHQLDLVLADSPMPEATEVRAYNHLIGESGVTLLAEPGLAAKLKGDFPECLQGAPLLIPGEGTAMRGHLLRWLEEHGVHPQIIGEFDDSALMRDFGKNGQGVFPAPSQVADDICEHDGLMIIGQIEEIPERFYAITVERRVSHPAVLAIMDTIWTPTPNGLHSRHSP